MKKNIFKNMDWGILICSVILCAIGMVALFSATQESGYDSLQRQVIWFVISILAIFVIIFIDYETIAKISPIFYRNFYNIVNSCIIYRTDKWCY